ncbi:hypothetical protein J6590_094700 [Homalodisca vitripennis]|nr:hypothetical protein J6590_036508 [Homalodisca vitripennis]KAG8284802.1 hypothetical protein J6590_094700 [Homalodisca vitripennis]
MRTNENNFTQEPTRCQQFPVCHSPQFIFYRIRNLRLVRVCSPKAEPSCDIRNRLAGTRFPCVTVHTLPSNMAVVPQQAPIGSEQIERRLVIHSQSSERRVFAHSQSSERRLVVHSQSSEMMLFVRVHSKSSERRLVVHSQSSERRFLVHSQNSERRLFVHSQSSERRLVVHSESSERRLVAHSQSRVVRSLLIMMGQSMNRSAKFHVSSGTV